MSYEIRTPNGGYLTMSDVDFKCPKCQHQHIESDYEKRLQKAEEMYIYVNCKNRKCGVKIGVATNYKGDVVAWLKSEEKLNEILDNEND